MRAIRLLGVFTLLFACTLPCTAQDRRDYDRDRPAYDRRDYDRDRGDYDRDRRSYDRGDYDRDRRYDRDASPGRDWQYYPSRRWQSAESTAPDNREEFVYPSAGGGSFRYLGDARWVETNPTGRFYYVETQRTPDYIQLRDVNRGYLVRLGYNQSFQIPPGSPPQWLPLYPGHWQ